MPYLVRAAKAASVVSRDGTQLTAGTSYRTATITSSTEDGSGRKTADALESASRPAKAL